MDRVCFHSVGGPTDFGSGFLTQATRILPSSVAHYGLQSTSLFVPHKPQQTSSPHLGLLVFCGHGKQGFPELVVWMLLVR